MPRSRSIDERSHRRKGSKRHYGRTLNRVTPEKAFELARMYDQTGCTVPELAAQTGFSLVACYNAVLLSQRRKNRLYGEGLK